MAFQSVPNTAEAVIRYEQNARPCTMTFYGRHGAGYDGADILALATLVDAWAAENFITLLSGSSNYIGTNVRGLESINDYEEFVNTEAGAGVGVGAPAPNLNAVCIGRFSGFTGRSARGRVYWPMQSTWYAANEDYVLSTVTGGLEDVLNSLNPAMLSEGWQEVIVSRQSLGVERPVGVTFSVEQYICRTTKVAKQSKRRPGGN